MTSGLPECPLASHNMKSGMRNRGHSFRIWCFGGWALMLSLLPTLAFTAPDSHSRTRSTSHPPVTNNQPPGSLLPAPSFIPTFDRYTVILSRMPFGDEAAAAAAAAAASAAANASAAAAESFAKNLKMCAITKNHFNHKIQVGLLDSATKKSYFLYEGDSEDGIELKSADYEHEKALLRKGEEEVWMDMNAATPTVATAARPAGLVTPPSFGRRIDVPPPPRLRTEMKPIFTGEALEKHLKDYQMELIRAGGQKGPPLPMELTPEMDDQLVKEGVLPPAE